jgi:hypothetical protein
MRVPSSRASFTGGFGSSVEVAVGVGDGDDGDGEALGVAEGLAAVVVPLVHPARSSAQMVTTPTQALARFTPYSSRWFMLAAMPLLVKAGRFGEASAAQ